MKAELGENWLTNFKDFDKQTSVSGSTGQVNFGESIEGEKIACKLK